MVGKMERLVRQNEVKKKSGGFERRASKMHHRVWIGHVG